MDIHQSVPMSLLHLPTLMECPFCFFQIDVLLEVVHLTDEYWEKVVVLFTVHRRHNFSCNMLYTHFLAHFLFACVLRLETHGTLY